MNPNNSRPVAGFFVYRQFSLLALYNCFNEAIPTPNISLLIICSLFGQSCENKDSLDDERLNYICNR